MPRRSILPEGERADALIVGATRRPPSAHTYKPTGGNVGIGASSAASKLTVAGTVESTTGGVKYPDGNTQTKALANCSAEGDVAVMRLGAWVCRSALRYLDNGDGTVTDQTTGLMWEKKVACAAADTTKPNCVLNNYTWSGSGTAADGTLYTSFLAKLNSHGDGTTVADGSQSQPLQTCFAGHCDWRVPDVFELQSILLAPFPCATSPCIDAIFGLTQAAFHWSSSSLASNTANAWDVNFNDGRVFNGRLKLFGESKRAVRSGR